MLDEHFVLFLHTFHCAAVGVHMKHVKASFGQRACVCVCVRPDGEGQPAADSSVRRGPHTTDSGLTAADKMKDCSLSRISVIVLCAAVFVAVLVVNALAGAGRGEFITLRRHREGFSCCSQS